MASTIDKTTRAHLIIVIVIAILITIVFAISKETIFEEDRMYITGNIVHENKTTNDRGASSVPDQENQNGSTATQAEKGAAAEYGAPIEFAVTYLENITIRHAEQELRDAREARTRLVEQGLGTLLSDDVLADASKSLELGNARRTIELSQFVVYIAEKKILLNDKLLLVKTKEKEYAADAIDVTQEKKIIENARDALTNDRLEEASQLITDAQKALDASKIEKERQSRLTYLSKGFLLRHWWKILLIGIVLAVISRPTSKKIIAKRRGKKIARLRTEMDKIENILKQLQKDCFIEKKITPDTYKKRAAHYEERIGELKHTIPVLEAQLHARKERKGKKENKKKVKGILEVKR
jgi:hypothetical protein